mgnify:CR=1 FL=1
MLPEELHDLAERILTRRCEMQNIELKRAAKGTPEKLYNSLSSFSNQSGGGIILFGIDEKNNFEVTGVYDPQDLQTIVTEQALQMEPVVRPVFTVAEYKGKTIVSAEIAECETISKPCFYRAAGRIRGSYIRVGESDQPMTEYEVYSYEAYRKKIRDELRTVDRAGIQDLYKDTLTEYFIKLRQAKPNLSRHTEERILQLQGITDEDRPTVAGLLLLGEYPQAFFPQMSITAMLVDGTEIGPVGESGARFCTFMTFPRAAAARKKAPLLQSPSTVSLPGV